MEPAFNLISEPWIPCLTMDSQVVEMGLRDTLVNAQSLRGIQGETPLVSASLYRILLAVIHSVIRGPKTRRDWVYIWKAKSLDSDRIDTYLNLWHDRFYLFHPEHPFYQGEDERMKPKSVLSLIPHMASGNNAALFDHHLEEVGVTLSPPQACRALITAQAFGLAGLCNPKYKLNFTDGPCARGITFLIEGNSLFETLVLNLIKYAEDEPFKNYQDDLPAWENDDPFEPSRENPRGYLDYLTWQNRRISLIPEIQSGILVVRNMTVAPGLRLDSSILDPFKHYRKDEKRGELVWRFYEDRTLWRDSSVLFEFSAQDKYRQPLNFRLISNLVFHQDLDPSHMYRFMALGMANDQAKVDFYRHEYQPLPLSYFSDEVHVENLSRALEWTNNLNFQLRNAIGTLACLVISPKSDGKKWGEIDKITKEETNKLRNHWGVDRNYWGALEIPFYSLVESIPKDPENALHDWRNELQRTAWDTFRQAERLAGNSPSALKAAVRASGQLAFGLKKLFPSA